MQILVYILIFLSFGLVLVAVIETFGESVRLRRAKKSFDDLRSFAEHPDNIEPAQRKKIVALLDSIAVGDIKYSGDLEATLRTLKNLDLLDNSERAKSSI